MMCLLLTELTFPCIHMKSPCVIWIIDSELTFPCILGKPFRCLLFNLRIDCVHLHHFIYLLILLPTLHWTSYRRMWISGLFILSLVNFLLSHYQFCWNLWDSFSVCIWVVGVWAKFWIWIWIWICDFFWLLGYSRVG